MKTLTDYINENLDENINESAAAIIAASMSASSNSHNSHHDDDPKTSKAARIISSAIRWMLGIGAFGLMTLPSLAAGIGALVIFVIACMFNLSEPIDLVIKSGFTDETVKSAVDDDETVNDNDKTGGEGPTYDEDDREIEESLKDVVQKFKNGFKKMTHGALVKILMTNKKFAVIVNDFIKTHKEELKNKNMKMKELSKLVVDYFKEKKIDDATVKSMIK